MKNIHILPTDKPSRLYYWEDKLVLGNLATTPINRNIYITSDEEIGTDEYYFHLKNNEYYNSGRIEEADKDMKFWRKIILTTDQDLIKDGVQAIDDEFLEWFVQNPSCERVEVVFNNRGITGTEKILKSFGEYKIIIPKAKEPINHKNANLNNLNYLIPKKEPKGVIDIPKITEGQRMYSEEQVIDALHSVELKYNRDFTKIYEGVLEYLKELKNK